LHILLLSVKITEDCFKVVVFAVNLTMVAGRMASRHIRMLLSHLAWV